MARKRDIQPVHPGQLLEEEFMRPLSVSQYRLAKATGIAPIQISHIIRGKRAVTVETALRLGRFFDTSAEFWINAQSHYDLVKTEMRLAKILDREVTPYDELARV